jgi:hypothetical protein
MFHRASLQQDLLKVYCHAVFILLQNYSRSRDDLRPFEAVDGVFRKKAICRSRGVVGFPERVVLLSGELDQEKWLNDLEMETQKRMNPNLTEELF